jgi:hypothetical protein
MLSRIVRVCVSGVLAIGVNGCSELGARSSELGAHDPYPFQAEARTPRSLTAAEIEAAAALTTRPGDIVRSVAPYVAPGIGQTVVRVVVENDVGAYGFVVDEDGTIEATQDFWAREREARVARFGKMIPELFALQASLAASDQLEVDVMVYADVPEPELPFDGTERIVSIEEFEDWTRNHSRNQQERIVAAKSRVLTLLDERGASVSKNPRGLPIIRATVSGELLRSAALNASDVVRIDPVVHEPSSLAGYAGRASMNASVSSGGLSGGACFGACDGGGIDVGQWESTEPDGVDATISGIARNNGRVSTGNTITGYFRCPTTCTTDADCPDQGGLVRRCQPPTVGGAKICVQDHVTWVAASVGMSGSYSYNTTVPQGADPIPNVPAGTNFAATGAWKTDQRVGNDLGAGPDGLDFLIAPPSTPLNPACQTTNAPPTPYVNRSQGGTPRIANWPGRAFGTFMTAASGNFNPMFVACAHLKNGLCVGMYDYEEYNVLATHHRTNFGDNRGSSFLNDSSIDATLERPHLLGPGNHLHSGSGDSGLHMPSIDLAPPTTQMRHAEYAPGIPKLPVVGTSFAAPSVLSIAIQAHQYKGWFSALAFPMVNKAVLLAATRDANNDGAIGKANVWSQNAPNVDAEDGAGQINIAALKATLDNNRFHYNDLSDASFSSCGSGCRKYTVTTLVIPQNVRTRVALAWHTCMIEEGSTPVLNNDLDLALNCGSPLVACGGTMLSNTESSELEMLERPGCSFERTCAIEVRIKNGATLQQCGSTTTERIGVGWSFNS